MKLTYLKYIISGVILIGIASLNILFVHQNHKIKDLQETIHDQQLNDSIRYMVDSIKYKQLQLKFFSDSLDIVKNYRDSELESIKGQIKIQINKYEQTLKILPNSSTTTRDSIWTSEFSKHESDIK
jgi:hypothetical protein